MSHLDEGTIHAWLDDALGATEAASVAEHIAQCAACSELVAEARGLIAASSRIVNALDGVPAAVTPAARAAAANAAVAQAVAATSRASVKASRSWLRSPQFAAAASLAVVLVGSWSVWRRTAERSVADVVAPVELPAAPSAVAVQGASSEAAVQRFDSGALTLAKTKPSADAAPAPAVSPSTGAAAPARSTTGNAAAAQPRAEIDGPKQEFAERARELDAVKARDQAARAQPELSRTATPVPASAAASGGSALAQADVRAPEARKRSNEPAAVAPAQRRMADSLLPAQTTQPSAPEGARAEQKLAVKPDSVVSAEVSRLRGDRAIQLGEVVTTGATVSRPARPAAPRAGMCYRISAASGARQTLTGLPNVLQLTDRPADSMPRWFVARVLDQANTSQWAWSQDASGTLSLRRTDSGDAVTVQAGRDVLVTPLSCP